MVLHWLLASMAADIAIIMIVVDCAGLFSIQATEPQR